MDALFAPADTQWRAVSPQLRTERRVILSVGAAVFLGAAIGAGVVAPLAGVGLALLVIALWAWGWYLIGRNYASWAYAERAEDLLIRHGVLVRRLVIVPYGRMQFVDVVAGPLDRAFGIAELQLHTAAAATDARITGLPPDEATRLRDRLTELGETQAAGL